MITKVKNLHGTGEKSPSSHASWLEYWVDKSGQKAGSCSAGDCNNKAALGGHVKKVGGTDNSHYITPLCDSCNKRADEFYAYSALVSASEG